MADVPDGDPIWEPAGGHIDGALCWDGVDDYVGTPFVLNPGDGQFSVFAWVNGGAPGQVILSQRGEGANWLMAAAPNGELMTELTSGRGGPLASAGVVTDGAWHHAGYVRDGSNRILYVDDIEVARDTVTSLEALAVYIWGPARAWSPVASGPACSTIFASTTGR
jgi:hypothetical protein